MQYSLERARENGWDVGKEYVTVEGQGKGDEEKKINSEIANNVWFTSIVFV